MLDFCEKKVAAIQIVAYNSYSIVVYSGVIMWFLFFDSMEAVSVPFQTEIREVVFINDNTRKAAARPGMNHRLEDHYSKM